MKRMVGVLISVFSMAAFADQGTTVMPARQMNLNDINYSGQAGNGVQFRVLLHASCFGTNLRSVANPLSPNSTVHMTANMTRMDGATGTFAVSFPASIVIAQAPAEAHPVTVTGISTSPKAAVSGQTLLMTLPDVGQAGKRIYSLNSVSFVQEGASGGTYMGNNGPLSASVSYNYSSDNTTLEISAAFPGQTGFCGGYFSPLMVFFDSSRPALNGSSEFKLRPEGEVFFWPEGSSKWAFLVIDKNGNDSVDDGGELFGPDEKFVNGFEALAALDSNKDGVIDKRDKDFSRLRLWFDANGNGKTEKGELVPLAKKDIVSVSLKYEKDKLVPVGERGEFRERGTAKTSKNKTLEVIDVWLGVKKAKTK